MAIATGAHNQKPIAHGGIPRKFAFCDHTPESR